MPKQLLRTATVVTLAAVALAFALPARAEEKPEKKRHQATGVIDSMDAKAKTVTIKKHDGSTQTFGCSDKCKFSTKDKEAAMMDDLKAGDKVVVVFAEEGGKSVATSIKPAKPAEKKEEKKSDKSK